MRQSCVIKLDWGYHRVLSVPFILYTEVEKMHRSVDLSRADFPRCSRLCPLNRKFKFEWFTFLNFKDISSGSKIESNPFYLSVSRSSELYRFSNEISSISKINNSYYHIYFSSVVNPFLILAPVLTKTASFLGLFINNRCPLKPTLHFVQII